MRDASRWNLSATTGSALGYAFAAMVGCSGGSSQAILSCGPGTAPVGGQCLPAGSVDSGAETSAGSPGHPEAGPDGTPPAAEGGPPSGDASSDATASGHPDAGGDSQPSDGQVSTDADAPSDPCKAPGTVLTTSVQCDTACSSPAETASICQMATCAATVQAALPVPISGYPYYIRTPRVPGVDPQCTAQCPGNEYVFGLGFSIPNAAPAFTLRVTAPWVVVTNVSVPFCSTGASSSTSCVAIPAGSNRGDIFIMTNDPNAPARNIYIDTVYTTCP